MIKMHKISSTQHQPQQIWAASSRRYPFRKQSSLAVEPTTTMTVALPKRQLLLKKQMSLDQTTARVVKTTITTPIQQQQQQRDGTTAYWETMRDQKSNETSLRIMAAINKKRSTSIQLSTAVIKKAELEISEKFNNSDNSQSQSQNQNCSNLNNKVLSNSKCLTKDGKESKINININMSYVHDTEYCNLSDSEPVNGLTLLNPQTEPESTKNETTSPPLPPSALVGLRRTQFQGSRNINSIGEMPVKRTPLARPMSAPIRALNDDLQKQVQKPRKPRRKIKLQRDKSEITETSIDVFFEEESEQGRPVSRTRFRKPPPPPPRTQSAMGCEVETLVSLLSSSSDSEKEEIVSSNSDTQTGRPPMLRKTVSFQEDDFQNIPKDFPPIYRRASIVPLAARIRAKRPPTAPAGSIYLSRKIDHSSPERKKEPITESGLKSELTSTIQIKIDTFIDYPDDVQSPKERECWRLYKKMSDKGLVVAYDTILRGMLTPTELRVILKQREVEKARQQAELVEEENEEKVAKEKSDKSKV